jgi:thiamine pyrophosphokinase
VLLAGDYEDEGYYRALWSEAQLVVAADGGYRFARQGGLRVDLLVGDLDSLDDGSVAQAEAAGVEVRRHPVRKDRTDGELAVEAALESGAGELLLAGALGGGLDHVLGHIAVLRRAAGRGVRSRLVSPSMAATVLAAPAGVRLSAPPPARVSLVALSSTALVTLRGLSYPLERGTLTSDACLGLGNQVDRSAPAEVHVHDGAVVVLVFDGAETFRRLA